MAMLPSKAKSITEKKTTFATAVSNDFCLQRDVGPHLPPNTEVDPLVLFEIYFDNNIVRWIIDSTLAYMYAYHKKNDLTDSYCKFIKKSFTKDEFCFIGALILLGLPGVHNHRYAWITKKAQTLVRLGELQHVRDMRQLEAFCTW